MFKHNRLVAIFMTLAMTLTLFAGMTMTASAYTATGTMTTLWNSGNPSNAASGTYYSIGSKTELEYFRNYVNLGKNTSGVTFYLTSDITLNPSFDPDDVNPAVAGVSGYTGNVTGITEWTPIGGALAGYSFQGVFDGCEKTIENIFYNQCVGDWSNGNSERNNIGLFGKVEENAIVFNINMSGGYIGAQRSVGSIAGKSWGTIHDCCSNVTVYSTDKKGVGGICGANWVNTTTNPPEIYNCCFCGTVTAANNQGSAGGIAGENEGQIYNCCNCGTVTSNYNAGGIVGSNKNDYNKQTQTGGTIYGGVTNSYNAGSVSGVYAGGIAGYELGSMRNVYNIGSISGTNAGQLIGEMKSSLTHENLFIPAGTSPAGTITSGTLTLNTHYFTFGSTGTDKTDLRDDLNTWVNSHNPSLGSAIYSTWKVGSGNDGYPVFSWQ